MSDEARDQENWPSRPVARVNSVEPGSPAHESVGPPLFLLLLSFNPPPTTYLTGFSLLAVARAGADEDRDSKLET